MTAAIVITAALGRWRFDSTGLATRGLAFGGCVLILCVVLALTVRRKISVTPLEGGWVLESVLLVAYLGLYIALAAMQHSRQDDLVRIWAFLVVIPAVFFRLRKQGLETIGLDQRLVLQGIKLAALVSLLWFPLLLYANYLDSEPGRALISDWNGLESLIVLAISFIAALLFAGFPEEFFFRGVLQSSLLRVFRRPLPAILVSAFLFAIYHLPYAFFVPSWDSQGDLGFSLSLVMTSQFFTGFLFGMARWKSDSLIAPVLLHTLVDTFVLYSSSQIAFNIG
jgi:membrane protease YdiL (CAAX protease family)